MGSDSDLPVMKEAAKVLSMFDVPHEVSFFLNYWTDLGVFTVYSNFICPLL